jgi:leader peptidase (prepilin peptidase)/N-methyltransferase
MAPLSLFEIFTDTTVSPLFYWWLELLLVSMLGLIFGSFSSAIIYRVPRNLPWAKAGGRSRCTACGVHLAPIDLIPVVSWMNNRGACRHCFASVSKLYPALEFMCAALCASVFLLSTGDVFTKYALIVSVPFWVSLVAIDLQYKLLPNQLVAILAVIAASFLLLKLSFGDAAAARLPFLMEHIGGAVLYGVFAFVLGWVMKRVLGKDALGMGDVKFFVVAGLWLGASYLSVFCILSGILGVALGMFWKLKLKQDVFPFGPALIASLFLILLLNGSFLFEKTLQYFLIASPS